MTNLTIDMSSGIEFPMTRGLAARVRAAEYAANPLLAAARILLQALADTPEALDANGVIQRRHWLEREVRVFGSICAELELRPDHVRITSYSLCTALDEAAMQTHWGEEETGGIDWQANGLAVSMGYDRQGRDRVFRLIEQAMLEPQDQLDLLEVFQNILDLGFKGRFRFEAGGLKQLRAVREAVHSVVATGGSSMVGRSYRAPMARLLVDPWVRPAVARRKRRWVVVVSFVCALMLLGATGYAAADHWIRARQAQEVSLAFDRLARNLEISLGDEIAAGNVELQRDAEHSTVTLRFVGMFASGEAMVAPWNASLVAAVGRELAAAMAADTRIQVVGYADSLPDVATHRRSNLALSESRARHVAQILSAAGVPMQHVSISGEGDADPLADNGTIHGRTRNRRVEILVSMG
ncbi:type IVB secretion system protein IcmH/DotU [Burkholderia ubonensis]|uniref:type IVB secretion system protein IcmH/DotU n=1 Tax=Burkholderia ubonensis TaxID=101571 RepID=UPI000754EA62|nr:type IVB secretion system protein IcmH/DotU [Burkholderia ubonensis]KWB82941.1 type IV secretion protein DotU [Burkholderia ubonensis]